MRIIGQIALLIMMGLSLYSAYILYVGNKSRKGEAMVAAGSWAMIWQFAATTFASAILFIALIKDDFSFLYVVENSMKEMTTFFKISAFWAGHEGSLLLWLWMLTGYTAVLAIINIRKQNRLSSLALFVANFVQIGLAFIILAFTNPFAPAPAGVPDGGGLNPLLMHWAMIIHPPTVFMGYAGMTIPFAFAVAALIDRDGSALWVKLVHKWTLFGWLFITFGLFLGALWAYVVLGWGGFWGWDPVENATLLPWFTGTALLHTLTMYRRRGGMKLWAVALATLSFVMCVTATFVTRSGLINSVHSFQSIRWDLVAGFGGMMLIAGAVTVYLMMTRAEEFEAKEAFNDFLSRHFTYYLNNLALVAFTSIIIYTNVISPLFGRDVSITFYQTIAPPLGLFYLLLITLCPFLGWNSTDPKELGKQLILPAVAGIAAYIFLAPYFGDKAWGIMTMVVAVFSFVAAIELFFLTAWTRAKNRGINVVRAFGQLFKFNRSLAGGYISHLAMAILFFGVAGSMTYVDEIKATVQDKPGQVVRVAEYDLIYQGFKEAQSPGQIKATAILDLKDRETGKVVNTLKPEFIYTEATGEARQNADIHYEPFKDIFVVFQGLDNQGRVALDVKVNPLIMFVWIGSTILAFGMIIAMWPKSSKTAVVE